MKVNGQLVAQLRRGLGWTQVELAERIGVHRLTLARWEQSRGNPQGDHLIRLAVALKVRPDILFVEEEPKAGVA